MLYLYVNPFYVCQSTVYTLENYQKVKIIKRHKSRENPRKMKNCTFEEKFSRDKSFHVQSFLIRLEEGTLKSTIRLQTGVNSSQEMSVDGN